MAKDKDEARRIQQMRGKLILQKPFYGSLILQMKLRELPGLGTFGTDGRALLYDPVFSKTLNDKELLGVLCHEATHVAALHPIRRRSRNHGLWNVACDVEVNHVVVNMEYFTLPANAIPGETGTAEMHYDKMYDEAKKNSCSCGQPQEGEGEGDSEEEGGDGGGSSPETSERNQDCPHHGKGWGCKIMEPELGPGETWKDVAEEIKDNVRNAVTSARMAGKLPAGMERFIDDFLTPKLQWDEILRRFVESVYEQYRTWSRPNRRYLHRGVALPGTGHKARVSEIAIAIDTSGSIGNTELQQAAAEVRSVLEECYPADTTIPIIWFDSTTYVDYVTREDVLVPKGGGGTRFAAIMERFEEDAMTQKGLVVITDGYCGDFGEEPEVPVLWVVFGSYADSFEPPFGEVVELELDG